MQNLYIFDCFGVVVSDVSTLWMNKHFSAEQQQYARTEIYRKVDCGLLSFDKSFDILADMCKMTKEEVLSEWNGCIYPLPETLKILSQLKRRGKVALLSNASEDYIEELFTRFDLYKYFDKLFVSAHYGYAKPDKQFYKICLDSFSENFDKVYFTDDNPKNLEGLEDLGITPILFTTAENLKKDLNLRQDLDSYDCSPKTNKTTF